MTSVTFANVALYDCNHNTIRFLSSHYMFCDLMWDVTFLSQLHFGAFHSALEIFSKKKGFRLCRFWKYVYLCIRKLKIDAS